MVSRQSSASLQEVSLARLEELQVVSQAALRFINKGACLVERQRQAIHCLHNLLCRLEIGRVSSFKGSILSKERSTT